jgi:hypothetical protein
MARGRKSRAGAGDEGTSWATKASRTKLLLHADHTEALPTITKEQPRLRWMN